MSIKIVTDSTSYIPENLIEKYDITIVSLCITLNNESFREVEIDKISFYEKLNNEAELPKSSQPALEEVQRAFEEHLANGDDVVGIFLSSDMSGTYSSTHIIKEMLLEKYPERKIELIDSRSNCMQMGFSVLAAAEVAYNNATIEEVVKASNSVIERSRFLFTPDNLTYLKKGGRIGGASALFGALLQIKPILTVLDGKTDVFDKVRTKKKAIDKIVNTFTADIESKGLGKVIVHHINCEEEGRELAERIKSKVKVDVEVTSIGPVIGVHVGPGAIGLAYYTEKV